jgi:uncharacterized membrane protein YoaK (UPF0700 family)
VNTFLAEVRGTLVPQCGGRHGPLPPLLLALTLLTGLVDAFSYLVLGHVFVANMTGNVVFLGFALAGAPSFSIAASVVALASFWSGALVGGKVGSRLGEHRGRLLHAAASIRAVFLVASVVLAALAGNAMTEGFRYPLIVVLGIAMGQSLPTPALDRHDTAVVWDLRLHGEPGGPTSITGTARSVLAIFHIVITFLSGHTWMPEISSAPSASDEQEPAQ